MIRDDIKAALVAAMKGGDKAGTATIRLIQSAIKNRDIEARTGKAPEDDDLLVTEVLQKMIKQRRESVELYRKGNREELAATEEAEIAVIERFLPKQMSDEEASAAIQAIIAETGASGMKDMGKVMGEVKSRLAGQIDPARASAMVRASMTWTRLPAGSPLGEASHSPAAEEVAITQNGEAASQSRSMSSSAGRDLSRARSEGSPSSATSSATEAIVVHALAVLTPPA